MNSKEDTIEKYIDIVYNSKYVDISTPKNYRKNKEFKLDKLEKLFTAEGYDTYKFKNNFSLTMFRYNKVVTPGL